jgi:hypothetical protein
MALATGEEMTSAGSGRVAEKKTCAPCCRSASASMVVQMRLCTCPPRRDDVGEFGAGGREVRLRNKAAAKRTVRTSRGSPLVAEAGLVATLGRKQGHHGTAALTTTRKSYELF